MSEPSDSLREQFGDIDVFGLKDTPVVGPILFHQSALVYFSWALTVLIALRRRWLTW